MPMRWTALLALAVAPAFCADWNAKLAEHYLDSRQKEWAAWPNALVSGVVCVSCHTGLPYLVARPALRQSLREKSGPTLYEDLLVEGTRATVFRTDAKELFGGLKGRLVDQVYGARVGGFGRGDRDGRCAARQTEPGRRESLRADVVDPGEGRSGARLLAVVRLQSRPVGDEGLGVYYGAALGALATGLAPGDYQSRPEIRRNVEWLTAYLRSRAGTHILAQPVVPAVGILEAARLASERRPAGDPG